MSVTFRPLLLLILLGPTTAFAGPPFLTDDPEPVPWHHYEAYLFTTVDHVQGTSAWVLPAFEFNYGAAPNLQLHAVVPAAYATSPGAYGIGDVEVGSKYRFVKESAKRPEVGFFPLIELPTGNSSRGLGNGQLWAKLPVWVQKSKGPWTTYGGVGYQINHAPGMKDSLFAGWLIQRQITKRLTLGAEVFHQEAQSVGSAAGNVHRCGRLLQLSREPKPVIHARAYRQRRTSHHGVHWTVLHVGAENSGVRQVDVMNTKGPREAIIIVVLLLLINGVWATPESKQTDIPQSQQGNSNADIRVQKRLHTRCTEAGERAEADASAMIPGRSWTWQLDFERSRQQLAQLRRDFTSLHDCESEFEASLTPEQKSKVKAKLNQLAALCQHLDRDAESLDLELRKGYPTRWHVARDASDMQKETYRWRTLHDQVANAIGAKL
jgi:hypothetical protein